MVDITPISPFVYNMLPSRVIFGSGSIKKLVAELQRQNLSSPLLLSTPQQVSLVEELSKQLNGKIAGIFWSHHAYSILYNRKYSQLYRRGESRLILNTAYQIMYLLGDSK